MVGTNQKPVFNLLQDEEADMDDEVPSTRGCCSCFFPCGTARWERWSLLQSEGKERRWVAKAKEVKEWSEVVAGPKWKTFLRRFRCGNGRRKACGYNPESYALNFDDGDGGQDHEQESLHFSTRFACPSRKGTAPAS